MSNAILLALLIVGQAPMEARRFEPLELRFEARESPANPFTDVALEVEFRHASGLSLSCDGFFDGDGAGMQAGAVYRARFAPPLEGAWQFTTTSNLDSLNARRGEIACGPAVGPGPAMPSRRAPRHFEFAGSGAPYYPLGATAYHLFSPANDDDAIIAALDAWQTRGYNRLRVLLSGYPRDDERPDIPPSERRHVDMWRRPNYGAPAGSVLPLPAWLGRPHAYDFARFDLSYWHKVERAVRAMRERGIVACCIFTIEKQDLPSEYGAGSDAERRFYRYAVSRLAAYDNVWWDLGNEHNEYRDAAWTVAMGEFVKRIDPYDRPLSAHAYADWKYGDAAWADFIITQQHGSPTQVNAWALKYRELNKPYINEENGYEGLLDEWGQGQRADLARQNHWAIAMAGGYATYGSWDEDASFYSGAFRVGPAGDQLGHLRTFFESLPFLDLEPVNERLPGGLCLTDGKSALAGWLPALEENATASPVAPDLAGLASPLTIEWFDPRTGQQTAPAAIVAGETVARPSHEDWALTIRSTAREP